VRTGFVLIALLVWSSIAIAREQLLICSASDRESYFSEIRERLYENWKVPYENRSIACTVLIKQDFRGEVLYVGIANCSDDPRIHKSVIDATYQASPLPLPKNQACFRRDTIVRIESRSQSATQTLSDVQSDEKATVAEADHAHEHGDREQGIRP